MPYNELEQNIKAIAWEIRVWEQYYKQLGRYQSPFLNWWLGYLYNWRRETLRTLGVET